MNSRDEKAAAFPARPTYEQRFSVPFDYPVHFTRRVFDPANSLMAATLDRLGERRRHRAAVYVDSGVAAAHPGLVADINEYFHSRPKELELAAPPQIIPGGERAKQGWRTTQEVMWTIGNLHLDRQSFVIAVGGGAVLDMAGFAASIVHRGVRLVRVPTTTLSQSDAGVGVKTSMNEHGMKNYVGTFAPPFAVLNDFDFLPTLSFDDWIGAVSEAFKVAIIKDAEFFDFLLGAAPALRRRDEAAMEAVVYRSAVLHLEHIATSGDPFEFGSARPLDFGHWAAHKLEVMSEFRLRHGQAVAVGLAIDSYYAMRQKLISPADLDRILRGLVECGLPVWSPLLEERGDDGLVILAGLEQFREHLGGTLTITLPDGIGRKCEVHQVFADVIEEAISYLKKVSENP